MFSVPGLKTVKAATYTACAPQTLQYDLTNMIIYHPQSQYDFAQKALAQTYCVSCAQQQYSLAAV
jgi:ribosomal protein S26